MGLQFLCLRDQFTVTKQLQKLPCLIHIQTFFLQLPFQMMFVKCFWNSISTGFLIVVVVVQNM